MTKSPEPTPTQDGICREPSGVRADMGIRYPRCGRSLPCPIHSTPTTPEPATDEKPNFEGHQGRDCGEHRTVGPHRAWCLDCTAWCYPQEGCPGCQVPQLLARISSLEVEREELRKVVPGLLEIARLAMPGTYFATDSRIVAALAALGDSQ